MCMNIPQFSACDSSLDHEQLLHYTSIDVLKIMLKDRTLKYTCQWPLRNRHFGPLESRQLDFTTYFSLCFDSVGALGII